MAGLSTLCYIEQDGKYLMLHRTVKKNDVNKDKWIGVGGHFEADESPEECLLREVWEETGYRLTSYRYRAVVTFVSGNGVTEYMSLFTADGFTGEPIACNEGELEWVDKNQVLNLNIWEGDKIFFRLLDESEDFFSLKLVYDGKDKLVFAALNGTPMELFDVLTEQGEKTGVVRERGVAHRDGSPHGTAHIWVVRENGRDGRTGEAGQSGETGQSGEAGQGKSGGYDVLLQKRSAGKDSYPGCYDISAAGHVAAGDGFLETAVRELAEELGIHAAPEQLHFAGYHCGYCEDVFYERVFRDCEVSAVYVYREPVEADSLSLQKEEVESVCWMDYGECLEQVRHRTMPGCIYEDEFVMLGRYLGIEPPLEPVEPEQEK